MGSYIIKWVVTSLAFGVTAYLLPGIKTDSVLTILIAALVFGLVNAFIKPFVLLITLPINVMSLGLFTLIINGFMIWITSKIVTDFHVESFWWGVLGAIFISMITGLLGNFFPNDEEKNNPAKFQFRYSTNKHNIEPKKVENADFEVIE